MPVAMVIFFNGDEVMMVINPLHGLAAAQVQDPPILLHLVVPTIQEIAVLYYPQRPIGAPLEIIVYGKA
jgi:hypothetical protein